MIQRRQCKHEAEDVKISYLFFSIFYLILFYFVCIIERYGQMMFLETTSAYWLLTDHSCGQVEWVFVWFALFFSDENRNWQTRRGLFSMFFPHELNSLCQHSELFPPMQMQPHSSHSFVALTSNVLLCIANHFSITIHLSDWKRLSPLMSKRTDGRVCSLWQNGEGQTQRAQVLLRIKYQPVQHLIVASFHEYCV